MAVTPRTILSSPASAAVAALCLLAFSVSGMVAYDWAAGNQPDNKVRTVHQTVDNTTCDGIKDMLGQNTQTWSEFDWVVYANCFERHKNIRMTISTAKEGLENYPSSETLANIKGYHEILLGKHTDAIHTLEDTLDKIGSPTSGILPNNLAWASLWAPRELGLERARKLYQQSLDLKPGVCETLHTGLWVEYALARQKDGVNRYKALKNFFELRRAYNSCKSRISSGNWDHLIEVIGAGVLFADVDHRMKLPGKLESKNTGKKELKRTMAQFLKRYRDVSADVICRRANPLDHTHQRCVSYVNEAMRSVRNDRAARHNADKTADRNNSDSGSSGSGGGSGCAWATY